MRLKMEIEMEEASLHLSLARPASLLLAGGGGFNRSAHSAGPLHLLRGAAVPGSTHGFGESVPAVWATLGPHIHL